MDLKSTEGMYESILALGKMLGKEEEAEKLAGELEEQYDYCDVEVNCGGQPIYYCIISVE